MARVYGEVVAGGDDVDDRLDVREVHFGMDTLCVEVKSEVDEVDVSCALAIAEQAPLNTVCSSQLSEFSSGNAGPCMRVRSVGYIATTVSGPTTVVMWMKTDVNLFSF